MFWRYTYRFNHVLSAITIKSNKVSSEPRVITTEAAGMFMPSVCKEMSFFVGSGCRGEGRARGVKSVYFKQGT